MIDGLVPREDVGDAALRQLRLQTQIEGALRRRFAPPPVQKAREVLQRADARRRPIPFPQRLARYAVAAAVLMALGAGNWLLWSGQSDPGWRAPRHWTTLAELYEHERSRRMTPQWICRTDHEFASTFYERLGQGLAMLPPPSGVVATGLSVRPVLSKDTVVLLGYAGESPVLVVVDRVSAPAPQLPAQSDLRLHCATLGALRVCEVSPLEAPALLPLLVDPQVEAGWYQNPPPAATQPSPKWGLPTQPPAP